MGTTNNMGIVKKISGKYDEAQAAYTEVLSFRQNYFGE
jgi:hypothetical protein